MNYPKKTCPKCGLDFAPQRGLYKRHVAECAGGGLVQQHDAAQVDAARPDAPIAEIRVIEAILERSEALIRAVDSEIDRTEGVINENSAKLSKLRQLRRYLAEVPDDTIDLRSLIQGSEYPARERRQSESLETAVESART